MTDDIDRQIVRLQVDLLLVPFWLYAELHKMDVTKRLEDRGLRVITDAYQADDHLVGFRDGVVVLTVELGRGE